jgi:SAM-dependent methyltransferase
MWGYMRSPLLEDRLVGRVQEYPAMVVESRGPTYHALTSEYAARQVVDNVVKTERYLEPILRRIGAKKVLDAGCGVGTMIRTLLASDYDAYGFDLQENVPHWVQHGLPKERFVVTDPDRLDLPFEAGWFDAVFSFGVIEHVGTVDGHATRRPDWHAVRQQWVNELFRVVRVGGHMLLAGPNRRFPVDSAHGLDADATRLERWLSQRAGVSIHRPWGPNFLWGFDDLARYTQDLPCTIIPLSVEGLAEFSRIPFPFGGLAKAYVKHLPKHLLGTGYNPWMVALVRRDG